MKLFGTTKNILIFMCVIAVVVIIADTFMFYDLLGKNNEVISIVDKITSKLDQNNKLKISEEIIKNNKNDIGKVSSYFVSGDKVVSFIESIENLGKESGITTTIDNIQAEEFSTSDEKNADSLKKLQKLHLKIKTSGNWAGTYKFASLLEALPYKAMLDSVAFSKEGDTEKGRSFLWQGDFSLTAVVIK